MWGPKTNVGLDFGREDECGPGRIRRRAEEKSREMLVRARA